jgi:hypothetical protein
MLTEGRILNSIEIPGRVLESKGLVAMGLGVNKLLILWVSHHASWDVTSQLIRNPQDQRAILAEERAGKLLSLPPSLLISIKVPFSSACQNNTQITPGPCSKKQLSNVASEGRSIWELDTHHNASLKLRPRGCSAYGYPGHLHEHSGL